MRVSGILKHGSSTQSAQFIPSSTEVSPSEEMDIVRGILKIPASVVASALCNQQAPPAAGGLSAFKSALKKDSSFEEKSLSPTRSILKSGAKADEWTASESSSEEDNNIKQNLASILSDVAEAASACQQPLDDKNALSSDECDTSSSGGREVKNIICSGMEYRSVTDFWPFIFFASKQYLNIIGLWFKFNLGMFSSKCCGMWYGCSKSTIESGKKKHFG